MRIIEVKKMDDCLDGGCVYRYQLDRKWTQESIDQLRGLGDLDYFPEFPKPFFRLCTRSGLQVKGVGGEANCHASFPATEQERVRSEFEEFVRTIA